MEWLKIQKYLKENFFFTKLTNSKEISDPIVKAVKENKTVKIENAKDIVSPLEDKLSSIFSKVEMLKGEKGSNGKDGRDGKDGKDGEPGKNGKDGKDGKNGLDGKNGKDGIDGKDGKSITPFEIAEIKREATPKKGIDYYTKKDKKELVSELKDSVQVKPVSLSLFQRETTMGSIADVNLSAPTNGQSLTYQASTGKWVNSTVSGGSGTPSGADTQVQFNDGGSFGGDAGLTYNKTTDRLTAGNVAVTDDAYDATSWNGNTDVPTKNAVRDKIESMSAGSGHTIKEAGTPLTARAGLNFGSGFDLSDDAGNDETDVALDLSEVAGSGDLSWSGNTPTVANGAITLAKQADMATASVVYRKTAGAGVPEVQTLATLKTDLGLTGTNSGDQTSIVGITGTKAQFDTAVTDGNFLYVGDVTQYTDELAQDAVGGMIADTATIDLTYTDATPELKADVKDNSLVAGKTTFTATDKILGRSSVGAGAGEEIACTAAGRAILDDTDASAQRTTLGLGTAATKATDLSDLNEATIEAAIDTLANLTSVQGLTVTLADAGADALLGWDDSASAYQNLSAADSRTALGLATGDSPQFTALNVGHASDSTITRVSAGVLAIEGSNILTAATGQPLDADLTTIAGLADPNADRILFWDDSAGAYAYLTAGSGLSISGTTMTATGSGSMQRLIFTAKDNEPPASAYATLDTRNSVPVLDFDASTDESAVFGNFLPSNYAGGGLTVTLVWMASSATTGDVVWNAAIEAHADDAFDIDSDGFAAAQAATGTTASASGEQQYTDITFTSGAQMDSLAAGESFRLKITRDADNGSDTMTGDAELLRVIVKETGS